MGVCLFVAPWQALWETVRLDEADFAGLDQGLRPIADPQLGQHMADVTLDRIWRNNERLGDFLIGGSVAPIMAALIAPQVMGERWSGRAVARHAGPHVPS
jgi:hypothetical protein